MVHIVESNPDRIVHALYLYCPGHANQGNPKFPGV